MSSIQPEVSEASPRPGTEADALRLRAHTRACLIALSSWLTPKRLATHAAIVAALMWLSFVFNFARPGLMDRAGNLKGADFLQFYAAGGFARAHRVAAMYGLHQFAAATEAAVSGVAGWHYLPVYPPQIALMFRPFASTPYLFAVVIWALASIVIYFGSVIWLARRLSFPWISIILAALAFPPFFYTIGDGQVSMLALACVTGAFCAFENGEEMLAGFALGCTAFKPPVFLALMIACLALRSARLLIGMLSAAALQVVLVWKFAGIDAIAAYLRFAIKLPRVDRLALAVKPYQMHSLRSFWMLLGVGRFEMLLWLLSSLIVLATLAGYWRSERRRDWRFAALLVGGTLIDPHLYIYDAVILVPALITLASGRFSEAGLDGSAIKVCIYFLFLAFLAAPLSQFTHVQFSVPILTLLFFLLPRPLNLTNRGWIAAYNS